MNLKHVFIIIAIFTVVSAVKKSFEGFKLYKVTPKDNDTVKVLENIRKNGIGEFWEDYFEANHDVKVMVPPEKTVDFLEIVNSFGIETKELLANVQSVIDDQLKPAATSRSSQYLSYSWTQYHDLQTIYGWLDDLQDAHPNIVKTVVIGRTVSGNPIKGIVLDYNPTRGNKLIGMIEGTLHAREWISAATVTWIIKEFLTSTDPNVRFLAETFEWHIFPVVNPDGYSYTFTHNRMWRKNRSPASFTSCAAAGFDDDMSHGVDLNRNFGYQWMVVGATTNPCSNTFAGPSAFSEPESQAIRQYTQRINEDGTFIYYIAFHSYTQLIVIPYSHVTSEQALLSGNYGDMYEIAIRGADALKQKYGTEYRVGISANVMYPMSGTSFDWVKNALNVPVTYLLELRDLGEFGFLLPSDQIIPTGLETVDALVEMDRTTRNLGYYFSSASSVYSSVLVILLGLFCVLFK